MKRISKFLALIMITAGLSTQAQERDLDNFRPLDKRGINIFESPKDSVSTFDGLQVRIGGASTIQFQSLRHENSGQVALSDLGTNFNLPTANLDLDVQLYHGVRMHLRTYLSSRHHPEPYVKDGYILIDRLDFINPGFMDHLMDKVTLKIGHMETNYGDAHFRRTDNAHSLQNPFVGNYIMDAFTTEVGAEVYYRDRGFLGMVGATNGKLNQSVSSPTTDGVSFVAKLGYDNYLADDFRFRLTGSLYHTSQVANSYLYSADRAGSRYYMVLEPEGASASANFTSGRYNPAFGNEITAVMINPFFKYGGLEFFGTFEYATGQRDTDPDSRSFTQLAGDLIYRFGADEKFYVAGRYNTISGEEAVTYRDIDINRVQIGAGWFMTKNILAKLEYVHQDYKGFGPTSIYNGGKFNGLMVEAAISF